MAKNGNDQVNHVAGSTLFFAPEVCEGKSYRGKKSDIWALGVTLYFMAFKKYPFLGRNKEQLYESIKCSEPDYPTSASPSLIDLFKKMFIKDPFQRISLDAITIHEWVTCNGVHPMPIK